VVKLNKIYTRTGDDGSTGLVDGSRLSKDDVRVRAYGDVDETNSVIGLVRLHLENRHLDDMLSRIQNDLFDLGADLATPLPAKGDPDSEYALRMVDAQSTRPRRRAARKPRRANLSQPLIGLFVCGRTLV